ncbi:MAG: glycosyltransferase [Pseudomonadota bacterium]
MSAVTIAICTFRRAHIAQTLGSLALLAVPAQSSIEVLVVDNDDTPSAQTLVEQAFAALPFPARYLHAPARNISLARNACLAHTRTPLLAFIDDDETVQPGWLSAMLAQQERTQAAAVLGPVNAIYPPTCPVWMRRGDFHSTRPVWVDGTIRTGYTGNVLLNLAHPALQGLPFVLELGTSGGEDTMFLGTLVTRGGTIAYAPDGIAEEPVTTDHARLGWLLKRRFRSGQTHAMLLGGGLKLGATALAKACACAGIALAHAFSPARMIHWLLRGTLHAGVVTQVIAGWCAKRQFPRG